MPRYESLRRRFFEARVFLKSCPVTRLYEFGYLEETKKEKRMNIYYDKDSHPQFLDGKKIAIIGYGSQGHAHANNLRDSGHDVVVGLRPESSSWAKAKTAGLKVTSTSEAASVADIVMM